MSRTVGCIVALVAVAAIFALVLVGQYNGLVTAAYPSIWPDICLANSRAIVDGLDRLIAALSEVRSLVAGQDREGILALLTRARAARINLPVGFGPSDNLLELAVAIPDRPGEIAAITTRPAQS